MTHPRVRARALVVGAFVMHTLSACEAATTPLPDAGTVETCVGNYGELDDAGWVFGVEIECPVGTLCGTGLGYQLCPGDGGAAVFGFGGGRADSPEEVTRARDRNPNYPYCERNEDCGQTCLFLPGCERPIGLCCDPLCGADGVRPRADCARIEGCALVHCGCDGETYEGLPDKPFAHVGPCAR